MSQSMSDVHSNVEAEECFICLFRYVQLLSFLNSEFVWMWNNTVTFGSRVAVS